LFTQIAPLFSDRNGGYTRVLKTGNRQGDAAEMAILELVVKTEKPKKKAEPKKEKESKKAPKEKTEE
jgi:large subunit ribosomal protein L17